MIRERAKCTAAMLGAACGVTATTILAYETGSLPRNPHVLRRYVEALDELRTIAPTTATGRAAS